MATGHEHREPLVAARQPFTADAPEATFSLVQLCDPAPVVPAPAQQVVVDVAQPVRTTPPSFREIRAGRAAAAARPPVAEIRIPVAELEAERLFEAAPSTPAAAVLPGMEQLVERVRQRTAARLSRTSALTPA